MSSFKNTVKDGVCTIESTGEACKYGAKSFPGAKELEAFALANPSIKKFVLGDTGVEFKSDLAWPTIGTRVTRGNKIVNGVDPKITDPNGGGGKTKMSAGLDAGKLVIMMGENAKVVVDKTAQNFTVHGSEFTGNAVRNIAEIVKAVYAQDPEPLRKLVAKPHAIATFAPLSLEIDLGEVDDEKAAKDTAVGQVATRIAAAGKPEMYARLSEVLVKLVGAQFDELESWVKTGAKVAAKPADATPVKAAVTAKA